ncbi:carboxypeptidase-like regulatory domain-containing protein [Zunongwangia pacifica]|uniref:Carboxypeptidase-like regulatory domain-containing protein n=1 Tax=Zunongwangia pacifica TaxID=2911062 RepID=A0A9X1ZU08_9FLAO|nr:carboxypeptidase-like regulatory domain-containing protein [Zunongwangia pacifica]MCL6218443.1 carboxypeptidase-like regulatory domain-containing protein [Zunongwangia pacifica]
MRNQIFFACILIIPAIGFSQSKVIQGKIVADSLDGSLINIVNISSGRGTTSDKFGEFTIAASINDTILFSSIQYKKKEVIINPSVYKNAFLVVNLEEGINELDEVKLPNLSGNLAADIKSMPINDKYALNAPMSLKMPLRQEEKLLYTATTGPGGTRLKWYSALFGSVPLDPIINGLSGRTKMLKHLNERVLDQNILETELDLRKSFLLERCHLTEEQLYLFINYCFAQSEFKELRDDPDKLQLLEFYKRESVKFLKLLAQQRTKTQIDSVH